MEFLYILNFFIFGAIIGSFLNVVINRFNTGRSINGRSFCPSCGQKINWYDLVPIISWIILRGKCRECHSKISPQYPLVEFSTATLFTLLYLNFSFLFLEKPLIFFIFYFWIAIIFAILVVIFVYDLKHKIIPDMLSYIFAGMGLVQTLILIPYISSFGMTSFYLDLLAGLIFFIPFFLLWYISNGRWIGLGDGKLVLGIGWFLGFTYGLNAIVLAFWLGAIFSLGLLLIAKLKKGTKHITMKSEIPFGPFLILATILEFFIRIDFLGISFFLK
jgi:leader peptidase (prepilin peptidase) / N-methyltransferase